MYVCYQTCIYYRRHAIQQYRPCGPFCRDGAVRHDSFPPGTQSIINNIMKAVLIDGSALCDYMTCLALLTASVI